MNTSVYDTLKENIEIIVSEDALKEKLKLNRPLNIKLGFDPTAPDLHLGHAVVLKKMRQFQEHGHRIKIIIGDSTALIGDPTGRNKTRPPLDPKQIEKNAETYLNQLSKIIDLSSTDIYYNSAWFTSLTLNELIKILSKLTVSQILQRSDFTHRYTNNIPISFHEMLYPVMQAYDSVMIDADIELGGTDQLFNCMIGRTLQGVLGKPEQVVACMPILRGTDGVQKMGKSLNNYIGLTEEPHNIFGKVMSIPDDLIPEYIRLASDYCSAEQQQKIDLLKLDSTNPMIIKKEVAFSIVRQYCGEDSAQHAAEYFYRNIQSCDNENKEFAQYSAQDLGIIEDLTLLELCQKLQPEKSRSAHKRLIESGAVQHNHQKCTDPFIIIPVSGPSVKVKIGKLHYFEICF